MAGKNIDIVFCFDDRIFKQFFVALNSLLLNRNGAHYNIHCVVDDVITDAMRQEIVDFVGGLDAKTVVKFVAPSPMRNEFESNDRWGKSTVDRLTLHKVLPNLDRVISLDIDVLFFDSLAEIWATDLGGRAIGMVAEAAQPMQQNKTPFYKKYDIAGLRRTGKYANGGLLLLDLKKLREMKIEKTMFEIAKTKGALFCEQDILNATFKGNIFYLSNKFNYLISASFGEKTVAAEGVVMLHYLVIKPWNPGYMFNNFGRMLWYKYAKGTPYYDELVFALLFNHDAELRWLRYKHKWPKALVKLACCFIPSREKRREIRAKYTR